MATAQEVIEDGLALINVPGEGGRLSAQRTQRALRMLRDIIATESIGQAFQPGRRQHYFSLVGNKRKYTYGPGGDFDTGRFTDPAPTGVEDLFIRTGGSIVGNELLPDYGFDNAGDGWTIPSAGLTNAGDFGVFNGRFRWLHSETRVAATSFSTRAGPTSFTILEVGKKYNFSFEAEVVKGGQYNMGGPIGFYNSGGGDVPSDYVLTSGNLTTTGKYEYVYEPIAATNQLVAIVYPQAGEVDFTVDNISLIEVGKDRFELSDTGTDYSVRKVDAKTLNDHFVKGSSGRPEFFHFNPSYPLPTIEFNNAPSAGEIVVIDAEVNTTDVDYTSSVLAVHPPTIKYLKYRLAYEFAGTVGKTMSPQKLGIMRGAFNAMAASNDRVKRLRIDKTLRHRKHFNINKGDA